MINLIVEKIIEQSGSTKYKLSPASFTLGGMDANSVDEINVDLPKEWQDKTVRIYFAPANSTPFYLLYDGAPVKVTANMTKRAGAIVIDAVSEDYHAYSTNANYRTYTHLVPTGEEEPEYTPSQIEQFLTTAHRYTILAQQANKDATNARDMAITARTRADTDANLAEEYRRQTNQLKSDTEAVKEMAVSAQNLADSFAQRADEYAQSAGVALNGAITAKNQAQSIRDSVQTRLDGAIAQLVPPEVTVKRQTTTEYILHIKDKNGGYDTPNLKGADGQGSGDMLASVYDTDGDGKVNSAQIADSADYAVSSGNSLALAGHSANYFATQSALSSLASVASSGSYNDLSDKPTIPTVNNATLTIKKNGTNVATFTANASRNVSANITIAKSDVGLSNVDNAKQMPIAGGTFTGTAIASETARTDRSIFNEETRRTSETGTLQSVKYFINVV